MCIRRWPGLTGSRRMGGEGNRPTYELLLEYSRNKNTCINFISKFTTLKREILLLSFLSKKSHPFCLFHSFPFIYTFLRTQMDTPFSSSSSSTPRMDIRRTMEKIWKIKTEIGFAYFFTLLFCVLLPETLLPLSHPHKMAIFMKFSGNDSYIRWNCYNKKKKKNTWTHKHTHTHKDEHNITVKREINLKRFP